MCSGCNRVWSILHVLWSVLYVTSGAAQLVAGIFFLLAIPSLILGCNLITGLWNICMGIGVGMVACCGQISTRRQEYLLYMTISILSANTVNAIVTEWGFYTEDLPKLLLKHQYHLLLHYASLATRFAAAAVILVSFVDSQLTFCSMQTTRPSTKKKLRGSHEQVSDIEYIIPRPKSSGAPSKQQVFNAYNTQSWVFESDNVNAATHAASAPVSTAASRYAAASDSPYLKLPQDARTPKRSPSKKKGDLENGVVIVADTTYLIDNPMVQVEEASDDSTSNSDRKLCYMKSFSRSASPAVLSASSSQISLNHQNQQPQNSTPIYECLEKLTRPETFRSRLDSSRSNREDSHYQTPQVMVRRADSASPQIEQVQYASLMKELEKAIGNKKDLSVTSPPSNADSDGRTQSHSKSSSRQDSSHSDGKNSDAEFSKELEAALQLIQDLESPNTIDTPSETKSATGVDHDASKPQEVVWRNSRSDSEKTLSAVGSLAEIGSPLNECQQELYTFKPSANGKSARIVVQYSDSQSTSGYSSPTHNKSTPKCWSTTSSLNGSNTDLGKPLSYTIHNTKSTAVISLFTTNDMLKKGKSVTLVNISGDNQPIHEVPSSMHENPSVTSQSSSPVLITDISQHNNNNNSNHSELLNSSNNNPYEYNTIDVSKSSPTRTTSLGSSWNVKSLLRRKKQSVPKLCPELEGAIVKSESLAYLTELELLARHQRNKDIQRQIEQRVQQQLGTPWNDND